MLFKPFQIIAIALLIGLSLGLSWKIVSAEATPAPIMNGTITEQLAGPETDQVATKVEESYLFTVLVPFVIKTLLVFAAAAATIFLIYSGWQYAMGFGDEGAYTQAKKNIIYAIIGLALTILSYAIVDILSSVDWIGS